ncbi:MAG: YfhO family protein [Ignavibacteriae bacterium]|nr:YfhO family protein [Ignavibacteriota bacterium]
MAKTVKKPVKPEIKTKPEVFRDLLENNWLSLGILLLFWVIFFRQLISGGAFIGDDFLEQYYPGKTLSAVSLSKGIIPFWNPFTFSGMPFFADLQIAIFYPFNYILKFFVSGEHLSPVVLQFTIVLHYLICSIFCFYIGKHFKFTNTASVIFSLMFTYSSYMIIHMIHMPLIEAVIWLPIIFLLWLKFIETKKYIFVFSATILMTFAILAGYPQAAFYIYLYISVYVLIVFINKIREKDFSSVRSLVIGYLVFFIFSFGMAAFQLLPSSEFVNLSNRAKITYNFAIEGSVEPRFYFSFFLPKLFGVWKFNEASSDISWWATKETFMFSIANIYISILSVVLIIPAIAVRLKSKTDKSMTWFLIGMASFSLLFATGGFFFFHKLICSVLPFFGRFRNPGHILFLYSFSVSLLTALGINEMLKNKRAFAEVFNKKFYITLLSVFTLVLILVYSGTFTVSVQQGADKINAWIKGQYLSFFIFMVASSSVIYFYLTDKIKLKAFIVLLLLITASDIYFNWYEQNNGSTNPEILFNQRKQKEEEFKNELKSEIFRVNMREHPYPAYYQRNGGMISRIPFLEGYGALILDKYIPINKTEPGSTQTHDIMNVKYKLEPASLKSGNPNNYKFFVNASYLPKARMFYDAKYFEEKDSVALKNYMAGKDFDLHKTIVIETDKKDFQLPVLKDSLLPKSDVKIVNYDLNNITVEVETTENGFLFLSEVYYPAWKAYVDGKSTDLFRADYCERAVYLEKGKHTVLFNYESDTFKTGMSISLPLLFIWMLGTIFFTYTYGRKKRMDIQTKDK